MAGFLRDLRFALRTLVKSPTFTAVAVVTLGLGIAAVTAIFSVVHAVVLKPLPFPKSEELVQIYTQFPDQKFDKFWVSPPEYFDLRRDTRSFAQIGAYQIAGAAISTNDRPVRAPAAYTTASFGPTVGVEPELGRWYRPDEDVPGDPPGLVISHRLWQSAFAGDPQILNRRVILDGAPAAIFGVMPPSFAYPQADIDLWIPNGLNPQAKNRGSHFLNVIARLKPGSSLASARAEMETLMKGWEAAGGQHINHRPDHPIIMYSLKDEVVGSVRTTLWLLQAAVLFVLLIACANVSNLLLARAEARSREIAIRNALGANRMRLVRQFITESLVLGVLGGLLGLGLAFWGVDVTVALMPQGAPRATEIRIDYVVLGFAVACALGTSLLFGLAPVVHTRVADLHAALKEGARTAGSPRQRFRRILVVSEVALAVVLVIGCGLVIKSFVHLQQVATGFRPDGLTTGQIEIVVNKYPKKEDIWGFWNRLTEELRNQPGVERVTLMSGLPPIRRLNANDCFFPTVKLPPEGPYHNIDFWNIVGDDYFETMGIRLVKGRFLQRSDTAGSLPVIVINETLARKFFPDKDPIGQPMYASGMNAPVQTIVGVVADMKQQGLEAPTGTEAFMSLNQVVTIGGGRGLPNQLMNVAVRSSLDSRAIANMIRNVVSRIDPTVPVYRTRSMNEVMYEAVGKPRFITFLLLVFSGIALLLAAVGIYGVMSYSVAQRTRELGIRMALGAQAGGVRRLVMREGLLLAGIGVVLGLGAAVALNGGLASRMAAILYKVRAVDPMTFLEVGVLVLAVAALACFIPARRATRVDPMIALRHD